MLQLEVGKRYLDKSESEVFINAIQDEGNEDVTYPFLGIRTHKRTGEKSTNSYTKDGFFHSNKTDSILNLVSLLPDELPAEPSFKERNGHDKYMPDEVAPKVELVVRVGGTYKTRSGTTETIVREIEAFESIKSFYRFVCTSGWYYSSNGRFAEDQETDADLVEEISFDENFSATISLTSGSMSEQDASVFESEFAAPRKVKKKSISTEELVRLDLSASLQEKEPVQLDLPVELPAASTKEATDVETFLSALSSCVRIMENLKAKEACEVLALLQARYNKYGDY